MVAHIGGFNLFKMSMKLHPTHSIRTTAQDSVLFAAVSKGLFGNVKIKINYSAL